MKHVCAWLWLSFTVNARRWEETRKEESEIGSNMQYTIIITIIDSLVHCSLSSFFRPTRYGILFLLFFPFRKPRAEEIATGRGEGTRETRAGCSTRC